MTDTERDTAEKAAVEYAQNCDTESHDEYMEKYSAYLAGYEQAIKDWASANSSKNSNP